MGFFPEGVIDTSPSCLGISLQSCRHADYLLSGGVLRKYSAAAAAAESLQSCPTLCGPIDGSPPGSPVPGILQARTLEWVAISFSNAWKWKVKVKSLSYVRLLATPWTAAYQGPPSMGFSRQEYWSGVLLPSPIHTHTHTHTQTHGSLVTAPKSEKVGKPAWILDPQKWR